MLTSYASWLKQSKTSGESPRVKSAREESRIWKKETPPLISDGGLKSVRTWNPARVAAWISSSPGFLIPSPASPATRITSDPRCAGCTRCSCPPSVATPATCTIAVYLVVPQSALDRYVLPALRTLSVQYALRARSALRALLTEDRPRQPHPGALAPAAAPVAGAALAEQA